MRYGTGLVLLQSAWLLGCLDDAARPTMSPGAGRNAGEMVSQAGCGIDESKLPSGGGAPLAKASQYSEALNNLPSRRTIRDVKIRFAPDFPSGVIATFNEAIGYMNWTYSDFRIRVVSSGENIYVKLNPPGSWANSSACPQNGPWDGCATWPVSAVPRKGAGAVGDSIWIRNEPGTQWAGLNPLKALIVHEIGHCLGMHHTTDGFPLHIPGTPTGDEKYSFMSTSGIFWDPTENPAFFDIANIFTLNDNRAMQKMFSYAKSEALGDVNGDGKADILYVRASDNQVTLRLSTGTGLQSAIACGAFGNPEGQYLVGDVSGDGKADLLFVGTDNQIYIRKSTGSAFSSQTVFAAAFGAPRFGGTYKLLDFNGDGKKDVMFVDFDAASVKVKISTGTTLGSSTLTKVFGERSGQYFTGDFTGDGKEDILCAIRPGELPTLDHWTKLPHTVRMLRSNGTGFGTESEVVCGDCYGHLWNAQYFARDVNSDGKADLIFADGAGTTAQSFIALSTGSTIGQVFGPTSLNSGLEAQRLIGDFTGDGLADLIYCSAADNTVRLSIGTAGGFLADQILSTSFGTFTGGQWL